VNKKSHGLLHDKVMAGVILGSISNIPKIIVDTALYRLGFSEFFCWHVTGGVLVSAQWLDTFNGFLLGAFMDFFFAGLLGGGLIYFLYFFGENRYLFIKGILFNTLAWVFLCIMVVDQRISMYVRLFDPGHAYQSFIVHTVWAAAMSYLVIRYARSTVTHHRNAK